MAKKSTKKAPKTAPKTAPKAESAPTGADNAKVCAILAYLLIGIIWYFVDEKMKKDAFVKFHVKQGIVLLIAWIIVAIVLNILWFVWILWPIAQVLFLVLAILGIINAANGKQQELPIIGQFAKNLTF